MAPQLGLADIPNSGWGTTVLDITSQATTAVAGDGAVDVGFARHDDATPGSLDVDDVAMYTCAAPPNSGVRGDWTNGTRLTSAKKVGAGWNAMNLLTSPGDMNKDSRGDLIARRSDGTLWFYPGRAGGGVLGGKQISAGWNIMRNVL